MGLKAISPPRLAMWLTALAAAAAPGRAQQPVPAEPQALAIGAVAPDFALPGATRFGVLARPIHLSDFRGKTVVLAFFHRARTKL
jgi:hypothetical protein